jgi:hypothetical protein
LVSAKILENMREDILQQMHEQASLLGNIPLLAIEFKYRGENRSSMPKQKT